MILGRRSGGFISPVLMLGSRGKARHGWEGYGGVGLGEAGQGRAWLGKTNFFTRYVTK